MAKQSERGTALVTGGAGFIGRAVVGRLLNAGLRVVVLDDLSSGAAANLEAFRGHPGFGGLHVGAVQDERALQRLPREIDMVFHLAARINVQASIDRPADTFESDVVGVFRALEWARQARARFVFVSSCMVYGPADGDRPIDERHPVFPASPYAASKLAGEHLVLAYGRAYDMPVVVLRPFNTYGPYQRSDGEGGVVAVFLRRALEGRPLQIFGDGTQTRDLLYVDDCADFIIAAGFSDRARSLCLNAGTGHDIPIAALAEAIGGQAVPVVRVAHPHPQAEIQRLVCDASRAREILGWRARVPLAEGLARTRGWLQLTCPRAGREEDRHAVSAT
jgi:UDP-glucose 4-epimerase